MQATEYHSHKWTLYLRSVSGEDLTHLLSKVRFSGLCMAGHEAYELYEVKTMQVVFQLHPSFDNPMREYTHPPYELTETGWGEFEIAVLVRCLLLNYTVISEIVFTCDSCCFCSCTSQMMQVRNL